MFERLHRYLPILDWSRTYTRDTLSNDMLAAVIVTIMLIPQSLAYAMLAGLPPEAGIYASIAPILLYAIFGTSRALAVGPVAVVSLMTAAAVGQVAEQGTMGYAAAALTLALLSGLFLLAMGLFRLGFLASFLSHPVIVGFITASGLLIAASQLRHVLGIEAHGHTLPQMLGSLAGNLGDTNIATLVIGALAMAFLFWVRKGLKPLLLSLGLRPKLADVVTKAGPVAAVLVTTLAVWAFRLDEAGVRIVGSVPQSLPPLTMPDLSFDLIEMLAVPALLISIIGFVESISVAQTFASKKRQRVDPDQELIGLGAANIGAAFTGGYPVTGGFARSVVNFDAGAETPAAGAFTAIGLAIAAVALTPLVYFLPTATLAATIIVAVLGLVDFRALARIWPYSKSDFAAQLATILLTLGFGVEVGIVAGVGLSITLHLYRTSRPHCAVIGQVPGTEHFRNTDRHCVVTSPRIHMLRVDESLYFPNARFLQDRIYADVARNRAIRHVVLQCSAVNAIDASALEALEEINHHLKDSGVTFHLSEVKGPVMDRLQRTTFVEDLTGQIYLTQYDAFEALDPGLARVALKDPRTAATCHGLQ
ncbi:SulP family inorganic anion transporter [Chachezhania antarctica]|uniref:SulP family inorganic anion transporter n=1 Tax=Chachezhania antarctica TaxID=2340860 RepID=UPI000EB35BE9|nr:sulfate permease [Chachezhania antarctica]|tara:strand:- start:3413 stop:5185 length:1773 start_codon:yes stop_codon:yes gene_type:complete